MSETTVYAVTGAKGGIGKTTTSISVASVLAAAGRSVLLVDADLAMANVADFLDTAFEDGTHASIHDVLAGAVGPADAIFEGPLGVEMLPCGSSLEDFAAVDARDLPALIAALRGRGYDDIVVDTGAGLSDATLLPVAAADEAVVVTRPRVGSVDNAVATIDLAGRVRTPVAGVVVTDATRAAPDGDQVADALGVDLLGTVPRDGAVPAAQEAGRPVLQTDPAGPAAQAYRVIARRMVEIETPGPQAAEGPTAAPETSVPEATAPETDDRPAADDRSVLGRVAAATVGRISGN
ncbi:MinD/ParA family ATP-binding protein [Halococcoides cellulosivorans]|uniref:Septum site-determining protein MinD n=1 Tax=Halococcoides cellulosivorans TaxID=1679096 RepID=A0A2R4WXR6_9EURY|nr:MinD/ParA family protein [Halococcoides cellulosivorans]AWB26335.1 septum site-determining protein MinD [Halococcoides cellulosivorans]